MAEIQQPKLNPSIYLKVTPKGVEILHNVSKRSKPQSVPLHVSNKGRLSVTKDKQLRITIRGSKPLDIAQELAEYEEILFNLYNGF
ncbi:MAG: hypothetical protein MJZ19_09380 [Paludibacteraceae bacterium]|nr:hypothetical protein [Paludibacteraceae bacterium]